MWRLAVPLVGHALGHVNVYAIRDAAGLALVDAGWGTQHAREALTAMIQHIGSSLDEVHTLLLTHVHADHAGLAGYVQRRSKARVVMHAADAAQVEARHGSSNAFAEETRAWLAAAGVPRGLWRFGLQQVQDEQMRFVPLDPDLVVHGSLALTTEGLRPVDALHTPGHTGGHLCFHDPSDRLLFTGDTVFRRINYGPTFRPFARPDPLGEYLASLDRLERLDVDRALPGHGEPFRNLPARLQELRAHHRQRAEEIRRRVDDGATTVWEVASRLARSQRWSELSPGRRLSAIGDAYAHLLRLARSGSVLTAGNAPIRWRPADGTRDAHI